MTKQYQIKVNGKTYEVEVAEVGQTNSQQEIGFTPKVVKAAPVAKPHVAAPTAITEIKPSNNNGAMTVTAPLPGKVFKILKNIGETVQVGEAVLILEAMKMENEIVAQNDGSISNIFVQEGVAVNPGDKLFTIE